jgi:hypothetical protein
MPIFIVELIITATLALMPVPYQTILPDMHGKQNITASMAIKSPPNKKTKPAKKAPTTTNAIQDPKPRNESKIKQLVLLFLISVCTVIFLGMLAVVLPQKIIKKIKESTLGFLEKKFR